MLCWLTKEQSLSQSQIPILTHFAMNDMRPETLKDAFQETGVYPLNKDAIDPTLLVGDVAGPNHIKEPTTPSEIPSYSEDTIGGLAMYACDEDGEDIEQNGKETTEQSAQKTPYLTLPCSLRTESCSTSGSHCRISSLGACISFY